MVNREIDTLIAEKVMGWTKVTEHKRFRNEKSQWRGLKPDRHYAMLPYFSTDIKAAWQIVEKLKQLWEDEFYLEYDHGEWTCSDISGYMRGEFSKDENAIEVKADNASMAICLAALSEVGIEIKVVVMAR